MARRERIHTISDLLETVAAAADGDSVTLRRIVAGLGDRSFGALLLVPGLALVILADRKIPARRLQQAVAFLRRPVGRAEGVMAPRLGFLADRPWSYLALGTCLVLTLIVPLMEIVPFLATTAGLAISLLAAGMLVRDGLMMVGGYGVVLLGALFLRTLA